MSESWQATLESIGFRPHGELGAMRVMVEDVEFIAIPHPLKGLAIMASHSSARTVTDLEHFVPLNATAQQVATVMAFTFGQIHPERQRPDEHWQLLRLLDGVPERDPQPRPVTVYVPSAGPESWRDLLADRDKHWQAGRSAKELAEAWERAKGFPPEVAALLSTVPALAGAEPLIVIPEHKVPLPGGQRPSQNDAFVLARVGDALASLTIEGKVDETFGPTLGEWRKDASVGKEERLAFLLETVGLTGVPSDGIRYQLLHRLASAVIEARRFTARYAAMIVHSFSAEDAGLDDYRAFLALFGAIGEPGKLDALATVDGVEVYAGWARGRPAG